MKYTIHAGAVLPLQRSVTGVESTFQQTVYRRQGEFHQLNLGLYVNKAHSSVAFGTVASCSRITATPS